VGANHKIFEAGNKGERIRSDCFISFQLNEAGGIVVNLKSKVAALYGDSIIDLVNNELAFFGIEHAQISIDDSGALPYTLMARIESVVKQAISTTKEYLPDMLLENLYQTSKDRFRFSRLYIPGNTPSMMINAGLHQPQAIILDLEDSVAPNKKAEACFLVRNALRQVDFFGAERMVRINQIPDGLEDLKFIVPHGVHTILIPKCESANQVKAVEDTIAEICSQQKIVLENPIFFMPIIESALGVENAYDIAGATPNVVAIAIGLEDYTADLGVLRTTEGNESLYARLRIINACKAVGIQPIDSVFSDIDDMDGLLQNVKRSKSLGFEGMGCIHPRQIRFIHEGFAPQPQEIEKAKRIVEAYNDALAKGLGVVALGTKMIDAPVVKRALKIIDLATKLKIS